MQIASAEAHEHDRRARMEAFALQGVENLVYTVHLIEILRCVVDNIGCLVVTRLPHIGTVAMWYGFHNPAGQILSCGVEVQNLIEILMVYPAVYQTFDFCKIAYHAIAVQLFGPAIDIDFPIVAMQILTFASIIEIQLVTGRNF